MIILVIAVLVFIIIFLALLIRGSSSHTEFDNEFEWANVIVYSESGEELTSKRFLPSDIGGYKPWPEFRQILSKPDGWVVCSCTISWRDKGLQNIGERIKTPLDIKFITFSQCGSVYVVDPITYQPCLTLDDLVDLHADGGNINGR